jgi:uncharacterized protein (DUF1684 family)
MSVMSMIIGGGIKMPYFLLALLLSFAADYKIEIEKWRAAQETLLRADNGWLTLAGLEWLHEGENRITPPNGAPDFGIFEMKGGRVTLRPPEGLPVELKSDAAGRPTVVERGGFSFSIIERGKRIGVRIRDKNHPALREFQGMKWFPIAESHRIVARWEAYDQPKIIAIVNVLGDVSQEKSTGRAHFRINGAEYTLEPIDSGSQLFFIFRDETSGKETYGGGRFLYADRPKDGNVILDFNKAINPPCAFTQFATCPLPPAQNRLKVRIEAGELAPPLH